MKRAAALIGSLLLGWQQPCAAAEQGPGGSSYCAAAQRHIVGTSLPVINQVHTDYDAFVKSKPAAQPLTSHQYVSHFHFTGSDLRLPGLVSCKFKSADELAAVYGDQRVAKQLSCASLIEDRLHAIRIELADSAVLTDERIKVDGDDLAAIGPGWLRPWPYVVGSAGDEGQIVLRAKALHVAVDSLMPMPASFKGTYYCHLPSDAYLRALLGGKIAVDEEFELVEQMNP